jgi:hypothetical protein
VGGGAGGHGKALMHLYFNGVDAVLMLLIDCTRRDIGLTFIPY